MKITKTELSKANIVDWLKKHDFVQFSTSDFSWVRVDGATTVHIVDCDSGDHEIIYKRFIENGFYSTFADKTCLFIDQADWKIEEWFDEIGVCRSSLWFGGYEIKDSYGE